MVDHPEDVGREQPSPPDLYRTSGGGRFPVPDPTALTTEALRREVAALQVLIEQRLRAAAELNAANFAALKERLVERERRFDERHQGDQYKIEGAIALCASRFEHVEAQIATAEKQRVEQKADTKAAVDAALAAQVAAVRDQTEASERAIAKSELSTTKQLEQQALSATVAVESLRKAIDENKERLTDLERTLRTAISEVDNKANAANSERKGATDYRSALYAAAGIGLAILAFIVGKGSF